MLAEAWGFFCALTIGDDKAQLGTAYAVTDVKLLQARRETFLDMCRKFPELRAIVHQAALEDMRRHVELLEEATFLTVEERLARTLIRESRADENAGESPSELILTDQDMAQMIGSSRETVSRIISKWSKEGLVKNSRSKLLILNFPGLNDIYVNPRKKGKI